MSGRTFFGVAKRDIFKRGTNLLVVFFEELDNVFFCALGHGEREWGF